MAARCSLLFLTFVLALSGCDSDPAGTEPTLDAGDAGEPPDAADAGAVPDAAPPSRDTGPDVPERTCPPPATPLAFRRDDAVAHPLDDVLRLNHLQAEATHNSYHLEPTEDAGEWAYSHAPLDEQLERQGVRALELDVHLDEECERFEVFHIGLLDERTTCRVLSDCLALVRGFSQRHPGHHPLFVQIELKDPASVVDEAYFVALENEILSVFDRSWIVTPDEVRGDAATVSDAIVANGWPTLAATRGRILFYLDDDGASRQLYTHGGRDLDGRLMFVDSDAGAPYAGVLVLNDPVGEADAIAAALAAGYVVRTRADSSPVDVRAGRTALAEALASGAQIVSTDFPDPVAGLDYSVAIPGGTPSRCSPVTAPSECTSAAIEDPALLAP
ncbi:MAG: hypothetical protein IT379_34605 [Deltaproteobacteria bacterium]|nr:hypothetical protein [Deltaproteobacteria bacterium]